MVHGFFKVLLIAFLSSKSWCSCSCNDLVYLKNSCTLAFARRASLLYFVLQYFDNLNGVPAEELPYYGGSVEIADYCPFSQEFSWHLSGEFQRSSDCRIIENQPGQYSGLQGGIAEIAFVNLEWTCCIFKVTPCQFTHSWSFTPSAV